MAIGAPLQYESKGNKIISFLKKLGILAGKAFGITVGLASVLGFFIGVYGPEKVFKFAGDLFESVFGSRFIIQISFVLLAGTIIAVSLFCLIHVSGLRKKIESEYENNNMKIQEILNLLREQKNLGILFIGSRESDKYSNDAYKMIYRSTTKELVISGHSLNKTINRKTKDDLRDEFMDAIIRLVKKDLAVKILLLKTNKMEDLENKRREFTDFVKETYRKMRKEHAIEDITISRNFLIKETDNLPYFIVKNENILHIAHYTFGEYVENSSKNMYVFEADSKFGYGKYCYDDFNNFFNKADFVEEYRNLFKEGINDK